MTATQPLGNGTYRLVEVTSGNITGTPNVTPTINGTGLASGATAAIAVSGGNVNLVVTGSTAVPANLTWTTSSGSLTDGAGNWDVAYASAPAAWFDGANYGVNFNNGDNAFFGGGTAGAGGTIKLLESVIAPGNMNFTNANGNTAYTLGLNSANAIVMSGGMITNNSAANIAFNAPLNGSFNYYSPGNRQMNLLADGTQTPSDIVTIYSGYIQLASNSGHGSLGSATIINNANLTFRHAGNFINANTISGTGKIQYQLNGAICTVNAPQTQTGYTLLTLTGPTGGGSKLVIGGSNILSTNSDFILNQQSGNTANSVLLDLNGYNQTLASIASDVNTTSISGITNTSGTASALTLAGNNRATYFKGVIAGKISLVLNGTNSTLILSNANTYIGDTIINAGKLSLAGSGATIGTPLISVANTTATFDVSGVANYTLNGGQMLSGNGAVTGAVTTAAGSGLAPGTTNVGTLSFSNNLTIAGNLIFKLNKSLVQSNDLVVAAGSLNNAGTGTLTVSNLGPALVVGDRFQLFSQPLLNGNLLTINAPAGVTFANNLETDGSLTVLTTSSLASSNALLTSLILNPTLTFAPAFTSNVFGGYTATESYGKSFTVTVTNADLTAANQLTYDGNVVGVLASGIASSSLSLNPNPGMTNVLSVRVTAQDNVTVNTYAVNVVQLPSQMPPTLTNSVNNGTNLVLNWPLDHLGYRLLMQTNNLNHGVSGNLNDWDTVAGSSATNMTIIHILQTNLNEYYRLAYP